MSAVSNNMFGQNGLSVNNMLLEVPGKVAGKIVQTGFAAGKAGTAVAIGAGVVVASDMISTTYDIGKTVLSVPVKFGCYATGLSNFGAAYKTLVTSEKKIKSKVLTAVTTNNKTKYTETEVESVRKFGICERVKKASNQTAWGMTKFIPTMAIAHGGVCSVGPALGLMEPCTGLTLGAVTSTCYETVAAVVSSATTNVLQPAAEYAGSVIANKAQTSAVIAGATVIGTSIYKDVKNWDSTASYFSQAKAGAYTVSKAVAGLALVKWGLGL